jgi:hypothetical protein
MFNWTQVRALAGLLKAFRDLFRSQSFVALAVC